LFPLNLTDIACRTSACPADKVLVRLNDGGGLYLEVAPNLSRRWFWKYYFGSKEKRLALGHYTETGSKKVSVSLKGAREARDDARKLLRKGTDPAQQRQLDKLTRQAVAGVTFESVARKLHATKHGGWSPRYAARWIERMDKDLFPWIGSLPLQDNTAPLLLHTLRRIENRGAHETAHTLRQTAGQRLHRGQAVRLPEVLAAAAALVRRAPLRRRAALGLHARRLRAHSPAVVRSVLLAGDHVALLSPLQVQAGCARDCWPVRQGRCPGRNARSASRNGAMRSRRWPAGAR
jgi:hypothetical protein